jgi:hypothetical protein
MNCARTVVGFNSPLTSDGGTAGGAADAPDAIGGGGMLGREGGGAIAGGWAGAAFRRAAGGRAAGFRAAPGFAARASVDRGGKGCANGVASRFARGGRGGGVEIRRGGAAGRPGGGPFVSRIFFNSDPIAPMTRKIAMTASFTSSTSLLLARMGRVACIIRQLNAIADFGLLIAD